MRHALHLIIIKTLKTDDLLRQILFPQQSTIRDHGRSDHRTWLFAWSASRTGGAPSSSRPVDTEHLQRKNSQRLSSIACLCSPFSVITLTLARAHDRSLFAAFRLMRVSLLSIKTTLRRTCGHDDAEHPGSSTPRSGKPPHSRWR